MRKCQTITGECFAIASVQCAICEGWFCHAHMKTHDHNIVAATPIDTDKQFWDAVFVAKISGMTCSDAGKMADKALEERKKRFPTKA